jgi:hypothetical protein
VIGRAEQESILSHLLSALPADFALLVLGNTGSITYGITDISSTKDVDVAIVVIGPSRRIASYEALLELVAALGLEPTRRPEDRSWAQIPVKTDAGTSNVDLIRGRDRDRPNGTFIERRILEAVAKGAQERGRILVPTITDLIVMKAWAAVDQERHLASPSDAEDHHRGRLRAYTDDARRIADFALRRDELDIKRVEHLLNLMRPHRRTPVRRVLAAVGVLT